MAAKAVSIAVGVQESETDESEESSRPTRDLVAELDRARLHAKS